MRARFLLLAAALVVVAAGCDWTQFRSVASHSGKSADPGFSATTVGGVAFEWSGATGGAVRSSPAVSKQVLYVGSDDGLLYAFDAKGDEGCTTVVPKTCEPLWTAATGGPITSSPAVTPGGVVLVGSDGGDLYAFDATGSTGCSGAPKTCDPLWTAPTGGAVSSSPVKRDANVVFVGSDDGNLYAFSATGTTGCSGAPLVCDPLWTMPTGGAVDSSPAIGLPDKTHVYVGSDDGTVYAFSATGTSGCSGAPLVCDPLWTMPTGGAVDSSPAVVKGVVYVGSDDGNLYAFDAAGTTGCSGAPLVCDPLWTAATGGAVDSSPAVSNPTTAVPEGIVYVGSADGLVRAFSADGTTECTATAPITCDPVGSGTTGGEVDSSPAVALTAALYAGSADGTLYAFDPRGETSCTVGIPVTCSPLWTATTGGPISSSPAVAAGFVYVGSTDGSVYAYKSPSGLWGQPTFYAPGSGSIEQALDDLDLDGDLDVAVTHFGNTVSVILNDGDGTFAPPVTYGTALSNSYFVDTGDLDGDTFPDLVATQAFGGISVLLNDGDGTFGNEANYSLPWGSVGVVVADVDDDTDLDVVVSNDVPFTTTDSVSVLLNDGTGALGSLATYAVDDWATGLAAGDLDGDGDPDLAVPNGSSDTLSVLLNDGDGTFAAATSYAVGDKPWKVAVADLDDDLDLDLAVSNTDSDDLSVLLNNGDGTFAASIEYATGDGPVGVAAGDVDGDLDADLVVGNLASDTITMLRNIGDGTFAAPVPYVLDVQFGIGLAPLDANGSLDIVANIGGSKIAVMLHR